jgi:dipeptidyl aminopeptidase/acylaminoacyl peptidase
VLALALMSFTTPALAQLGTGIVQEDVTTATGGRGVIVRPNGAGPFPAVLHLHGTGDTVANNVEILQLFAQAGYVAMDIEYQSKTPGTIDVDAIYASLEHLRNARFVKREMVGLNGFSLGARMALRVAANRPVQAVSLIAARTSSGGNPTALDNAARLTAPMLFQHGTQDPQVPYNDSVLLVDKLRGLSRRVEFVSHQGAGHNDLPWPRVYDNVLAFFRTHLR